MNRTTLITATIATALGIGLLLPQISANNAIRKEIAERTEQVTQLEQRARFPSSSPGAVSALNLDANRANKTTQERVDHAQSRIESILADIDDAANSSGELYKVMPELLKVFSKLDLEELLTVADGIDAPLNMRSPNPRGSIKMILMMLVAELDPARVLARPEVNEDPNTLATVLATLWRSDPDGASAWVAASNMSDAEKRDFDNSVIFRTLKKDFSDGIGRIHEMDEKLADASLRIISEFGISKEQLPAVVAALDKPEHAALRPHLASMILRDALTDGGIAGARARAEELGLDGADLGWFLRRTLANRMETSPLETIAWAKEALGVEGFATVLPNAIRDWAVYDFNAAGAWLGQLEPSSSRDSAVASYAQTIISVDPEAALTWALEIGDEKQQEQSIERLGARWKRRDENAAKAWFSAQGIPLQ